MNLSANLYITAKGEDEVKRRVYKLDMKKRSLLILLARPQSVDYLTSRSVLPPQEFNATIISLIQDGFIATSDSAAIGDSFVPSSFSGSSSPKTLPGEAGQGNLIDDDIVVSEAKFLLTNFCVDSFGTDSQEFVDIIRSCKSVGDIRYHLNTIRAAAEKRCPGQLPTLQSVVREINATA